MEILAYSPSELAAAMDVSRPTVYRWMRLPDFPVVHLGGLSRIPADAFKLWLNNQVEVKKGV